MHNASTITIDNLLNHRSGIHDYTNDEDYLDYYTKPKTKVQLVKLVSGFESDFEPSSKTSYSNSNYLLPSFILEKTFKKSYTQLLEDLDQYLATYSSLETPLKITISKVVP